MAGAIELDPVILEELRCSMCKRYLSCSPIQVRQDGTSVCGRCFSWEDERKCRNVALEAIASKVSFPCEYNKYGCKERVVFNHTNEHEGKCTYRAYMCPILPGTACAWVGSATQIYEHFMRQHPNIVKEKIEFHLAVAQDKQELLFVKFGAIVFAVKYLFTASTCKLTYDIRYIVLNKGIEALWKIKLTNNLDPDYSISTKGNKCLPFNIRFYDKQESKSLILTDFLKVLNNPQYIMVAMDLNIVKSNEVNLQLLPLNTNLLLNLRCKGCQRYLLPPIFDCKKGVVCSKCKSKFSNSKPTTDEKLRNLVANTNFPCRWHGCSYVQKGSDFGDHEIFCPFRIYECVNIITCKDTFKREEVAAHMESHGYTYFAGTVVYKVVFQKISSPRKFFTFKSNEIITLVRETGYDAQSSEYRHYFSFKMFDNNCADICAKVQVHHEHCKIKSKRYTVRCNSKPWFMNLCLLPDCFRVDEELTFTVTV